MARSERDAGVLIDASMSCSYAQFQKENLILSDVLLRYVSAEGRHP